MSVPAFPLVRQDAVQCAMLFPFFLFLQNYSWLLISYIDSALGLLQSEVMILASHLRCCERGVRCDVFEMHLPTGSVLWGDWTGHSCADVHSGV